jgi:hypothetical protein
MKKTALKITIDRETLRRLDADEARKALAAASPGPVYSTPIAYCA